MNVKRSDLIEMLKESIWCNDSEEGLQDRLNNIRDDLMYILGIDPHSELPEEVQNNLTEV